MVMSDINVAIFAGFLITYPGVRSSPRPQVIIRFSVIVTEDGSSIQQLQIDAKSRAVGPAIYNKICFKNATNELRSLTLPGPTGGAYNTDRICISEKS